MLLRAALLDPEVAHRRRWFTLLVLCLSLVIIGVDNTILNVALPTLGKATRLGGLAATESQLQWIVDGYTIVFAGLLLTAGSLGDRFGRYGALALGLAIFGVGSAGASQATSASMLIGLRCLMGVGGAFIMPSTLSILTNVFTNPKERGRAIGVWAGVAAIGIGLGPVTGGFLLSHFWWGSVLLVNVPVVVIALIAGYFLVPTSRDPSSPRLDPLGAVLSIGAIGSLLWAVIAGPSHGWGSSGVLIAFWAGTALGLMFLIWELTYSSPMLNVRFFKNPRFSAASMAITLTFLSLFGTIFLLTQYLQAVLGYSPLKAGAVLVPQGLVMMVMAPMSARVSERIGTKVTVGGGLLIVAASLALCDALRVNSSIGLVIVITVILGVGMANVMAPATESIMGSLPRDKAGVGSAINDTTRQFGGAVGVAVLGSLLSSQYRTKMGHRLAPLGAPASVVTAVRDNVQHALGVAQTVPRSLAGGLVSAARSSFVDGFHLAALAASGIAVVAAAGVFIFLPARAVDAGQGRPAPQPAGPEPEPVPLPAAGGAGEVEALEVEALEVEALEVEAIEAVTVGATAAAETGSPPPWTAEAPGESNGNGNGSAKEPPVSDPETASPDTAPLATEPRRRGPGDGSLGIGSLRPPLPGARGRYETSADNGNANGTGSNGVRPEWFPAAVVQAMTHRKR
jgi:EmrB/QacA subfamily drug resistance transporter